MFGAQARFTKDDARIEGESSVFERTGDEGGKARFHFCGTCGATVYYYIDVMPEFIAIPLGAFASRDLPAPVYSVYEDRKHAWVDLTGEIEHYD